MLVLVNDIIVEIDAPEAHAHLHWKRVLNDDPKSLLTSSLIEALKNAYIARSPITATDHDNHDFLQDIGALIVTFTGANVVLFPTQSETFGTRLTCVAEQVLHSLQAQCARGRPMNIAKFWQKAA